LNMSPNYTYSLVQGYSTLAASKITNIKIVGIILKFMIHKEPSGAITTFYCLGLATDGFMIDRTPQPSHILLPQATSLSGYGHHKTIKPFRSKPPTYFQ